MGILRMLLKPFSFLTIRHRSNIFLKILWFFPLTASFLVVLIVKYLICGTSIFGDPGLILRMTGFVQNLPGFYIAALAAIATFGSKNLDLIMSGAPPKMNIDFNGGVLQDEPLTRRLFLCSMFSYLTALSIFLTLIGILGVSFSEYVKNNIPVIALGYVKYAFIFLYGFLFIQLFTVTLWGISYLGERMHISDGN